LLGLLGPRLLLDQDVLDRLDVLVASRGPGRPGGGGGGVLFRGAWVRAPPACFTRMSSIDSTSSSRPAVPVARAGVAGASSSGVPGSAPSSSTSSSSSVSSRSSTVAIPLFGRGIVLPSISLATVPAQQRRPDLFHSQIRSGQARTARSRGRHATDRVRPGDRHGGER